jgi:iron-sulfur cluster repair protein YtfE (RIC family)
MTKLTECLEQDHRRLDGILTECKSLASAGSFVAAAERFAIFANGLSCHIDAEETVLFPRLLERAPSARGPVAVMRSEHEQIRKLLEAVRTAFDGSTPSWRSIVGDLEALLVTHNMKEERVLYPMADVAAFGPPGEDALRLRLVGVLSRAGSE